MATRRLIENHEFAVMVNVHEGEIVRHLTIQGGMTFMEAADFAIQAQGYFRFAIMDHTEWRSVEIEVGNEFGTIELIEIKR